MSEDKSAFSLKTKGSGHSHPLAGKVADRAAKKPQIRLNVMVEADKQREFKIATMKQGKTMSEAINTFIDDFISNK
jgi:hypothetical protein